MIDAWRVRQKLIGDEPLTAEEQAWVDERAILRADPAMRLLLDMGYAQEAVRESELGVAMRRAAGLLPSADLSPIDRHHAEIAARYLNAYRPAAYALERVRKGSS